MRAMKDSGIPWIGEIPEGWNIDRLQVALQEIVEKNSPIKTDYILSLTNNRGVIPYTDKGDVGNKSKDNLEEYKVAYPNTIVANSMNILIGSVGICDYYGCVSPVYYVFQATEKGSLRFFNYIMSSEPFQKHLRQYANGILEIRLRLSSSNILKRYVPFPSLAEQQRIAEFLDRKCAEVDEMIALQEQIIEELKAYKQSVITEAVTKGLNPAAPMRDSGIEWIGSIPEHWEVKRLKQVLSSPLQYGANESGMPYQENLLRYVRITDILDNSLRDNIEKQSLTEQQADGYILQHNDILFARSGGTVGKSFIFNEKYGRCAFAGYLIKASVNELMDAKFVYYFTQTNCYEEWKKQIFIQSTIQNIGADRYSQLQLTIPPTSEQQAIADYLDEKCADIDSLIQTKQSKIDSLKEYKKSIIYEYVTGKREVE